MEDRENLICPVAEKEISRQECKKIRAVFEETAPLNKLMNGIKFTDKNQIMCLHCIKS